MEMNELFKALSDPTRRRILQLLQKGDRTATDIMKESRVSQPTLSHHLDVLKRARLIVGEREGQFIRFSLDMSVFQMSVDYLMKFVVKE